MDQITKLKMKIGDAEFEGEGPVEVVTAQLEAFREMVMGSLAPSRPAGRMEIFETPLPLRESEGAPRVIVTDTAATIDAGLKLITKVDDRIVSLTARPKSANDAVLLILFGQKVMRENDSVTGGEVISGLTATGGLAVGRVDRLLEKAARDGDVIVIGERRGKRYRLTNAGLAKARQVAADLIALVA
jgi:hypothetical protein